MDLQLKRNRVKCLECGKVLESFTRWDYNICGCPNNAMVDGGLSYERYGAVDMTKIETMFEYVDADAFLWGVMTKDGVVRKTLDEIEDTHLQNIALHLRTRNDISRLSNEELESAEKFALDYAKLRHQEDLKILNEHIAPELAERGLTEPTEEIPY